MKKTAAALILSAILLAACHKSQNAPPPPPATIAGNWNIDSVTTYFYDSAGLRNPGAKGYAFPGYYFRFNADNSWVETLQDTSTNSGISGGTYTVTSDSTFTLLYANAPANTAVAPCKISLLTHTTFIFSKQLPTLFNGVTPGYIKYVFRLVK